MDTQKIVLELLATGLSQTELAKMVPCASNTISAYASGDRGLRPSYVIAARLLELHESLCKGSAVSTL